MSQVVVNTLDIEIVLKKIGTYEKALRIYFWSSLNSKLFLVQLEVCNNVQRFNFECQLHCRARNNNNKQHLQRYEILFINRNDIIFIVVNKCRT